ncbi:MAG: hpcH/HpaI aldolase/citrate lyase family protein [Solirubrobacterales bacterium]|nr:hpcH/HpaI aldolase/citrate lyase family protein [Solirubrobacterales bacterium]
MGVDAANGFLARLRGAELTLMLGVRGSRGTDVVRVADATGHHGILIDLEHSTMSLDDAARMCATAHDIGLTPFVRVPEREYGAIGRVLDGGASGIVAPRIETVAEARSVAGACRFPPRGQRSQIGAVPQLGMRPTRARELGPLLDDATIVQILLETPSGIANADAIAELDGVDMLAVGVNDLTAELGVPGEYADPRVRDAIATVGVACRRHGKLLMVGGVADLETLASFAALGACPLLLTGMDTDLLFAEAQARASRFAAWHDALVARSPERQEAH